MMASEKTQEELKYQKIIWKVICAGACFQGVEYMRRYDDFTTMFLEIPNPSWIAWLVLNMDCPLISVAAERNACMNIGRDMRPVFAHSLSEHTMRKYDELVEGPWLSDHSTHHCTFRGYELSLAFRVACGDLHGALCALRNVALYSNVRHVQEAVLAATREAHLNYDIAGFEQKTASKRFYPNWPCELWVWNERLGRVERKAW